MRIPRFIVPLLAIIACLGPAYWAAWEFFYKRRPTPADPFAPLSTVDRGLASVFRPAEGIDRALGKWKTRNAAHDAIQGSWIGLAWHGLEVVNLTVEIQKDTLTFTSAKEWPELHGMQFAIEDSEDSPDQFHIITGLGRINVKPDQETGGVAPQLNLWNEGPIGLFHSPSQIGSGAMLSRP
jgi:hypothetical protein